MRFDKRSLLLPAITAVTGLAVVLTTPQTSSAWPTYLTNWQSVYPNSQTDENTVNGTGCQVCHVNHNGSAPWNPYGWEIRKLIQGGMQATAAILAVENFDSEKNPLSWSNIVEINAGTQPGWTDGNYNIFYDDLGVTTGQPPNGVFGGSLNPASSPMVPMCDPGTGGVIACPCGNPSGGLNRGCNNSSSTTGAALHATGNASLGADTLLLKTAGERATSLSIVAQWIGVNASGVSFGMGVRCTSGTFKRLYSRNAVAGSITAPTGLDLSVSAQSAAKGDNILAGQSRWYVVYYRDPNVLGGCPPLSNFNATQTGQVTWTP